MLLLHFHFSLLLLRLMVWQPFVGAVSRREAAGITVVMDDGGGHAAITPRNPLYIRQLAAAETDAQVSVTLEDAVGVQCQ